LKPGLAVVDISGIVAELADAYSPV